MTFVFALKRRKKAILEVFLQKVSDSQWKHKAYTLNVNKLKFRIECVHACDIYYKKNIQRPKK